MLKKQRKKRKRVEASLVHDLIIGKVQQCGINQSFGLRNPKG